MSWKRAKYDECATAKEISQSTSPMYYMLDPNKFYNTNECRPSLGIIGGNNVSIGQQNMVDQESDLWGITRQNSKCPERKYIPHCQNCDEISGIPCDKNDDCASIVPNKHLPACDIINYSPRVDHVGFNAKYPWCTKSQRGMKYPPQLNPTQTSMIPDAM